jgi:WD40 repeat protein
MPLPLLVNVRRFRCWQVSDPMLAVAPGAEGKRLAGADAAGGLTLWTPFQNLTPLTWGTTTGVALFCLAWSPDTHLLVGGSADASLWLWDLTPGGGTLRLKGHRDAILGISFRPDGRLLASASADGTVRLWDLHRRAEVEQLPHPHTVCALHFTPDGQTLVAACEDGRIYVWGGTGHPASQILAGPLPPSCLALSPDQRSSMTGYASTRIHRWKATKDLCCRSASVRIAGSWQQAVRAARSFSGMCESGGLRTQRVCTRRR